MHSCMHNTGIKEINSQLHHHMHLIHSQPKRFSAACMSLILAESTKQWRNKAFCGHAHVQLPSFMYVEPVPFCMMHKHIVVCIVLFYNSGIVVYHRQMAVASV